MSKDFLPYSRQYIDEDDIGAVSDALRGELLTTGPLVAEWEEKFAQAVGAGYAVSCSSGTAGLHLASMALSVSEGDLVLVPAITFAATANAVRYCGAEVGFVDVDPETGLIDLDHLEKLLGAAENVTGVYPVHLAGQCPDMEALAALARRHGVNIVEDASHAIATTYAGGIQVGSCRHSQAAVFSTHPVKTLATGEGGLVTTNDKALYRRMADLRNHGMIRRAEAFQDKDLAFDSQGEANPWYYEIQELGNNYRLADINCALGLSQLTKLDWFAERRRFLARAYDELLAPLSPAVRPIGRTPGCDAVLHLYVVLIDFAAIGTERAAVMRQLREAGIGTQVHYIPVPWLPYYRGRYGKPDLPGAAEYYERALSLPLFPAMSEEDVARVTGALGRILGG